MNKANHLRSTTCFFLIFFLFLSIGSRFFNQDGTDLDYKHFTLSNHSGIVTTESQLPFEEKEEEKGQDHSLYEIDSIHFGFEPFRFSSKNDLFSRDFRDDHSRLPIYLSKRALLI